MLNVLAEPIRANPECLAEAFTRERRIAEKKNRKNRKNKKNSTKRKNKTRDTAEEAEVVGEGAAEAEARAEPGSDSNSDSWVFRCDKLQAREGLCERPQRAEEIDLGMALRLMVEAGHVNVISRAVEAHAELRKKFPPRELVKELMMRNNFSTACRCVHRFGLLSDAELLHFVMGRLVVCGQFDRAMQEGPSFVEDFFGSTLHDEDTESVPAMRRVPMQCWHPPFTRFSSMEERLTCEARH